MIKIENKENNYNLKVDEELDSATIEIDN